MKIFDRTNRAHPDAAEQTPEKRLLVTGSGGGNGAGLPTILTNEQATELAALLRHMAFAADDACGQDAVVDANRWAAEPTSRRVSLHSRPGRRSWHGPASCVVKPRPSRRPPAGSSGNWTSARNATAPEHRGARRSGAGAASPATTTGTT